jgi:uncharacterized membrane protein YfcA
MKEKTIVSTTTLATSLLAYWYARETGKDAVPLVMLGGFIGSIIGEGLAEQVKQNEQNNGNKNI